jgi:hypothetical protein
VSSSDARRARAKVAKTEGLAGFTTCLAERPLDTTYRRMVRQALNNVRTRKTKKQ